MSATAATSERLAAPVALAAGNWPRRPVCAFAARALQQF